jgi:predicted phosphodiesterase
MKIAVLSDIHGNFWALSEVLKDIEKKKPDLIINLGDSLYGPLNPKETFELIDSYNIISIAGNEDRLIIENIEHADNSGTLKFVIDNLSSDAFDWLYTLPKTQILHCNTLICHGTPYSDTTYLLEYVSDSGITVNDPGKIEDLLHGIIQKNIFCGHSHTPRVVNTPDRTIVNPGSIGLPAYDDDLPIYHKIENFHSNAQYGIVIIYENEVKTEIISLSYEVEKAVNCAIKNNRSDWAKWLKTGRV